jgi:Rab-GTPase-TBC domain
VDSEYYATRWFLTLFTYDLSIENISTVLDLFMVEGFKCLIKVSMALLSHAYQIYLKNASVDNFGHKTNTERLIDIIKHLHEEHKMESHLLLKMSQSFKVTSKLMTDMEKLYRLENNRSQSLGGWINVQKSPTLEDCYYSTNGSLKNRMLMISMNKEKKHEWIILPTLPSKVCTEEEVI